MFAESKLNCIEVLILKALIDSNISHDELFLINNVLKESYDMKEEIKNSNAKQVLNYIYKTMFSYCLKCRKNTESKNPKVVRTKNGIIMPLSRCAVCNSKKSKFFKEQEARGLSSNLLGVKVPIISDIPIVNTLF